jgi:Cu-Zn family superoxide dismutase
MLKLIHWMGRRDMKTYGIKSSILFLSLFFCVGLSCSEDAKPVTRAIAILNATAGNQVSGIVYFTQTRSGVLVEGELEGLTPGKHGFHIHEKGDCSASDGSSAGGHFNPTNTSHGAPGDEARHAGDMGNIMADENGRVVISYTDMHMDLNGEHSILGKGVIVHAQEDDLKTQPTGNAGGRVACGVIQSADE